MSQSLGTSKAYSSFFAFFLFAHASTFPTLVPQYAFSSASLFFLYLLFELVVLLCFHLVLACFPELHLPLPRFFRFYRRISYYGVTTLAENAQLPALQPSVSFIPFFQCIGELCETVTLDIQHFRDFHLQFVYPAVAVWGERVINLIQLDRCRGLPMFGDRT